MTKEKSIYWHIGRLEALTDKYPEFKVDIEKVREAYHRLVLALMGVCGGADNNIADEDDITDGLLLLKELGEI